jgi:uncharacterized iron-regulated membrane protein
MKRTVRLAHKYLSLTMAVLWLLQAVTGALLVFHWELDDSGVSGSRRPLNPDKLNAALVQLATTRPGQHVTAVYTSGGLPGRFDVVISNANGARDVLRVDGEGAILRERPWDHDYAHIGAFQIATYLHQTLFLHTTGNWIIGLSGILLFSNICLGLYQAWPRAGRWIRTLSLSSQGSSAGAKAYPWYRIYHWHRALGLMIALPALALVLAGIVRAFDDPLGSRFEAARPPPAPIAAAPSSQLQPPTVANVISSALALYPGSSLAGVEYPDSDSPWFAVRVTQVNDVRRYFGTTIVYIGSRDGSVLANYDARLMPFSVRLWDAVYALHTGEIAGAPGRCLALLVGVSLSVLIGLGVSLYFLRRSRLRV